MKPHLRILLPVIILIAFSAHPALAEESKGPRMVFPERSFDFGDVREGTMISHPFRVINKGDRPLEIKRVKPG